MLCETEQRWATSMEEAGGGKEGSEVGGKSREKQRAKSTR